MLRKLTVTVLAEDSVPYESPLLGQHGISLWIEAEREGSTRRLLVDVGQNSDALLHNVRELAIPLEKTDAVVITHCHYDHTKGLSRIVEAIGKGDLPVVAHPSLFRPHFVVEPFLQHVGVPFEDGAERLRAAGARLILAADPLPIMAGLTTSGEVPRRTDFESPGIDLYTVDEAGRLLSDPVADDLALFASVEGRGLVVVTGCSHAGIVNIVHRGLNLTGEEKVAALFGGFHLVESDDERIARTVSALRALSPDLVAAGHCTGFRAQAALYGAFGDAFTPLGAGRRFTVEA
ncbi:MBL fold metallo-hydrolase [Aminirod propionatiphilus]|uniref:MBL fold metallo-hydrolase n=1 Tax=Aminirod propionatiphilus TaxID=3415223 RepID=A0ACD1DU51_9BACT|nr:MBL fold metallo-hydrolase [Synergistota bacterium]